MDFGLSFESNAAEILRRFERLSTGLQEGVLVGLRRGLLLAESAVRRNTSLKWRRGAAGLSGRLTSYARKVGGQVDAAIGFRKTRAFPYELAQEFGAKAKGGGANILKREDVHYVLLKSIPARLKFRDNVGKTIPQIGDEVAKEVLKA